MPRDALQTLPQHGLGRGVSFYAMAAAAMMLGYYQWNYTLHGENSSINAKAERDLDDERLDWARRQAETSMRECVAISSPLDCREEQSLSDRVRSYKAIADQGPSPITGPIAAEFSTTNRQWRNIWAILFLLLFLYRLARRTPNRKV